MSLRSRKRLRSGWSGRLIVRRPRRGWSHVRNLLLLLGVWSLALVFLNIGGPRRHTGLAAGQRAPATVVAATDFDCVNIAATELLRRQAAEAVVPVFSIQAAPLQNAWRTLEKLTDRAIALRKKMDAVAPGSGTLAADLADAADLLGLTVPGEDLVGLFPAGKEMDVLSALKDGLAATWTNGILAEADRATGFQGVTRSATLDIRLPAAGDAAVFRTVALADLPAVDQAWRNGADGIRARLDELGAEVSKETIEALVRPAIRPNLDYDEAATEVRREAARRGVDSVLMTVREGTLLMEEGATVVPQTVEMLDAYNQRMAALESPRERRMKRSGDAALMLIVLAMCAGWLQGSRPGTFSKARRKWLLAGLGVLAVANASLYRYLSVGLAWIPPWVAPYAIPITLPALLAALMLGSSAALSVGLWSGLAAALIFGHDFDVLLLGLGGSALAVLLLRNVRKRSQVMRAGLAVGLFNVLLALALGALARQVPRVLLIQVGTGLAGGFWAVLIALVVLPLLEWLFRFSTNISLLELTDMSHPLLQRLALEAPGTYHHSLLVGAIGQAAANRIGANGLLVTVCAYFHDIGKLAKPEFFSENQRTGENPHDSLAPSMSALVIQSHAKEGLTLAKRYKLPQAVCDAIRTHHGTTLTSYFYQVARQSLRESGTAEDSGLESSFRYDGPKPWTREQAVLMLADSVEAASRSLDKPTPNRIAEMVETLIRDKLLDGQIDQCPLTLEELHAIRGSFVFTLSNVLHGRNPYPREDRSAQPPAGAEPPPGTVPASDPDAGLAGVSD